MLNTKEGLRCTKTKPSGLHPNSRLNIVEWTRRGLVVDIWKVLELGEQVWVLYKLPYPHCFGRSFHKNKSKNQNCFCFSLQYSTTIHNTLRENFHNPKNPTR